MTVMRAPGAMRIMDVMRRLEELGDRVDGTSYAIIRDKDGMPRAVRQIVVSKGEITFVTGRLMIGDISTPDDSA